MIECAIWIVQDTLKQLQMKLSWIMHMGTHLLHGVGNVRVGYGEVLESSCETPIM